MTESNGFDPVTGAWNDSLTGDFLWSRNNFGEARPDVLSPFTYSISEKIWSEVSFLPGYHLSGNICGRYYANVSVSISMLKALGKSMDAADVRTFHFLRAYHCAGRCTDCGACERVCPVGINMRAFTKKLEKDCFDAYGWEAGLSLEQRPPLDTYRPDDPAEFIK